MWPFCLSLWVAGICKYVPVPRSCWAALNAVCTVPTVSAQEPAGPLRAVCLPRVVSVAQQCWDRHFAGPRVFYREIEGDRWAVWVSVFFPNLEQQWLFPNTLWEADKAGIWDHPQVRSTGGHCCCPLHYWKDDRHWPVLTASPGLWGKKLLMESGR